MTSPPSEGDGANSNLTIQTLPAFPDGYSDAYT